MNVKGRSLLVAAMLAVGCRDRVARAIDSAATVELFPADALGLPSAG